MERDSDNRNEDSM